MSSNKKLLGFLQGPLDQNDHLAETERMSFFVFLPIKFLRLHVHARNCIK